MITIVDLDIPRIYVWNLNDIKRFIHINSQKLYKIIVIVMFYIHDIVLPYNL